VVLLGISWATHWELDEQVNNAIENMGGSPKSEKIEPHTPELPFNSKGEKMALMGAH
jgi:hypothetical protein